ncbi:MAG: hypothetical protein M1399_05435 [Actinobacteria bacterium]|nr:hypothetical protein [Actinomycetota bacterium]
MARKPLAGHPALLPALNRSYIVSRITLRHYALMGVWTGMLMPLLCMPANLRHPWSVAIHRMGKLPGHYATRRESPGSYAVKNLS